ncbi:MAG: hypothetical protein ACRC8M_01815 [Cetobacterium sp.]|uniref:hypothetical protein n=1 Tax=Cetobacterium sp. TaxID=2071632 RepID=UPI003F301C96
MIKIITFMLLMTTLECSEISYFRPSVKYEIKDPITIESNMDTIDFGVLIQGTTGVVSGHVLKVKGTGNMNISRGLSKSIGGLSIQEGMKKYNSTGELEVEYKYVWDTSKSQTYDLKGTRVIFTAYYE